MLGRSSELPCRSICIITRVVACVRIFWSLLDVAEPRLHGGEVKRGARGCTLDACKASSSPPKPKRACRKINKQQVNMSRMILSQSPRGSPIQHVRARVVSRFGAFTNDRLAGNPCGNLRILRPRAAWSVIDGAHMLMLRASFKLLLLAGMSELPACSKPIPGDGRIPTLS